MAGIPGLFGLFLGWVGSAPAGQATPAHTVSVTVYGPRRTAEVESGTRTLNIYSGRKTHDGSN